MKNVCFILTLISFLSCNSAAKKEGNEVFIFNDISFNLTEAENLTDLSPEVKEDYLSNFQPSHFQIPLYKRIQNKDYKIYLGLPFNTSIEKLLHYQQVDLAIAPLISQSDSFSYLFKKHHNDTIYISEYAEVFDGNLIYLLATTKSELISDSLFNQIALSNRFNQKKK